MKGFFGKPRIGAFALPFLLAVAALMLGINEASYWGSREALVSLNAVVTSRQVVLRLLGVLVDAETGQRGYLLTGRATYLEPYRNALEAVKGLQDQLQALYRNEPGLRAELDKLRPLIEQRLSVMAETIMLEDTGQHEHALQLVLTDAGQAHMNGIRAIAETILNSEAGRDKQAYGSVLSTLQVARIGVAAMTLLSLLVVALYLRQALRAQAQQRSAKLAIEAERNSLEAEVLERTRQLTELARHLQTAREDERGRLSRELHDELGALLTAAKLDVARIRARVLSAAPDSADRLAHLSETLNSGIALKRRIIEDLRPSALSSLGLAAALETLLDDFRGRGGAQIRSSLETLSLSPAAELTVYRLVQESLTNIAKYAKARHVDVALRSAGDKVMVSVTDDGIGFDPQSTSSGAHGLLGMRYRVEGEGGSLILRSAPGQGTRVEAVLPLHAAAPA
ncbi:CHASE3 domain-containing protein [Aquabacterium sp.]|uniref:CHASE3 domain-containing protein n=1 Tax=Aquabacterium sp. TaxID=1872578 RepID=UPI002D14FE21|nr:CHASE3 domain-containing protein [Aquabacterium sp.]HSW05481.1 CHASE3 domain-containing protein [Aquabacterium sp.]